MGHEVSSSSLMQAERTGLRLSAIVRSNWFSVFCGLVPTRVRSGPVEIEIPARFAPMRLPPVACPENPAPRALAGDPGDREPPGCLVRKFQ